jgi:hypothetical protein
MHATSGGGDNKKPDSKTRYSKAYSVYLYHNEGVVVLVP